MKTSYKISFIPKQLTPRKRILLEKLTVAHSLASPPFMEPEG